MRDDDTRPHNAAGDAVLRAAERIDFAVEIGDTVERHARIRDALGELGEAITRMSPAEARGAIAALRRAASFVNRPDPV